MILVSADRCTCAARGTLHSPLLDDPHHGTATSCCCRVGHVCRNPCLPTPVTTPPPQPLPSTPRHTTPTLHPTTTATHPTPPPCPRLTTTLHNNPPGPAHNLPCRQCSPLHTSGADPRQPQKKPRRKRVAGQQVWEARQQRQLAHQNARQLYYTPINDGDTVSLLYLRAARPAVRAAAGSAPAARRAAQHVVRRRIHHPTRTSTNTLLSITLHVLLRRHDQRVW